MTSLLHRFTSHGGFERKMQLAEMEYLFSKDAATTALPENYAGLPF